MNIGPILQQKVGHADIFVHDGLMKRREPVVLFGNEDIVNNLGKTLNHTASEFVHVGSIVEKTDVQET